MTHRRASNGSRVKRTVGIDPGTVPTFIMAGVTSQALRISEAAARAGVSPDTLRYYERQGVLPKAPRNSAGYRIYSEASVARIQFVRNALRFGFSLKQITLFVRWRDAGRPPCHEVRTAAQRILGEMDRQIQELTVARTAVRNTLLEWDQRLARTPAGSAARLLDTLTPTSPSAPRVKLGRLSSSHG